MTQTPPRLKRALFPASFDPITNGHLDLIHRAGNIFDEVIVAVARNIGKKGTFSLDERLEMLNAVVADLEYVRIESFDGLMVEYAQSLKVNAVIRGLRAMADFEYEFEMFLMNRHMRPEIEILFMMTSLEYQYVSSSRLKELASFGANVDEFVPPIVAEKLRKKLG